MLLTRSVGQFRHRHPGEACNAIHPSVTSAPYGRPQPISSCEERADRLKWLSSLKFLQPPPFVFGDRSSIPHRMITDCSGRVFGLRKWLIFVANLFGQPGPPQKTSQYVQDCSQLRGGFRLANRFQYLNYCNRPTHRRYRTFRSNFYEKTNAFRNCHSGLRICSSGTCVQNRFWIRSSRRDPELRRGAPRHIHFVLFRYYSLHCKHGRYGFYRDLSGKYDRLAQPDNIHLCDQ